GSQCTSGSANCKARSAPTTWPSWAASADFHSASWPSVWSVVFVAEGAAARPGHGDRFGQAGLAPDGGGGAQAEPDHDLWAAVGDGPAGVAEPARGVVGGSVVAGCPGGRGRRAAPRVRARTESTASGSTLRETVPARASRPKDWMASAWRCASFIRGV